MLNIKFNETHSAKESILSEHKREKSPTVIQARRYLDFQYGSNQVDVILPDGSQATLIIGSNGQAFFEFVSCD